MLVRREALLGIGLLDERFFIHSEEPAGDGCARDDREQGGLTHRDRRAIRNPGARTGS